MRSELERFLDCLHWIMPNLNDTFGYASADSERIYVDGETNQEALVEVFREFGHAGIVAYCAKIRQQEPIKELRTPAYHQAMDRLDGWEYEDD